MIFRFSDPDNPAGIAAWFWADPETLNVLSITMEAAPHSTAPAFVMSLGLEAGRIRRTTPKELYKIIYCGSFATACDHLFVDYDAALRWIAAQPNSQNLAPIVINRFTKKG